jgi:hypothetical protein
VHKSTKGWHSKLLHPKDLIAACAARAFGFQGAWISYHISGHVLSFSNRRFSKSSQEFVIGASTHNFCQVHSGNIARWNERTELFRGWLKREDMGLDKKIRTLDESPEES